MVDRFIDGDPTNNEANGTSFEHEWMSTQWRFGGDPKGLMNHLDYLQGMGIRVCISPLGFNKQAFVNINSGYLHGWKPIP